MPAALVQSKIPGAGNTATLTFDATPNANNLITVTCWSYDGTTVHTAPTDNKGNTYREAIQIGRSGNERVSIWYAYAIASSATFTITGPGGPTNYYWQCQEWSADGAFTVDPLDKTASTAGGGGAAPSVSTATLSQSDEIALAVASWDNGNPTTVTINSGWTQIQEIIPQSIQAGESDYQIATATTALTATWTYNLAPFNTSRVIATFKAPAASVTAALTGTATASITGLR